jgi:hypothetical protein
MAIVHLRITWKIANRGSLNALAPVLATEELVARGGFRDGQTAKARKGPRVQSLPWDEATS